MEIEGLKPRREPAESTGCGQPAAPSPADVRELAALAVLDEMGWFNDRGQPPDPELGVGSYWDLAADVADAVLAAVSPVIRRQEAREQRDAVKEIVFGTSVARSLAYTETPDALVAITAERIWSNLEGHFAAAIARTHAHPEVSSGAPAASPSAGGGTSG